MTVDQIVGHVVEGERDVLLDEVIGQVEAGVLQHPLENLHPPLVSLESHHAAEDPPVRSKGEDRRAQDPVEVGVGLLVVVSCHEPPGALEIFLATMDRPQQEKMDKVAQRGFTHFQDIGCAECHRPALQTESRYLGFSYSEEPADPQRNIFYRVDLSRAPSRFDQGEADGVVVELFSDLKRHDMGPALAESFHRASDKRNAEFITAKLWGVADTAPYLHDGRALTLYEAIGLHGGEARDARDQFLSLPVDDQAALIAFLKTLRNPRSPNRDILPVDK